MCGRFSRGLTALEASLDVFREQPSLAVLPLASLVVVGGAYTAIGIALVQFGLVSAVFTNQLLQYGVLLLALAVSSVFGVFFNAAVVYCTAGHLRGEPVTVREGLAHTWAVRWNVLKWGLLSATVGTVIVILEDNIPGVGSLVHSVLGLTWGMLTFFIVPVIVLERIGRLRSDLRYSGKAFADTWGESVTATVGIGVAFLPPAIVGGILLGYAFIFGSGVSALVLGAIGGALLVTTAVLAEVIGMVARTSLYHYAKTGESVPVVDALGPDNLFDED